MCIHITNMWFGDYVRARVYAHMCVYKYSVVYFWTLSCYFTISLHLTHLEFILQKWSFFK